MLPELYTVNKAATWNESYRSYLGRSHRRKVRRKMQEWDEWLRRRIRQYIWKQWKKPKTRVTNLKKLGIPEEYTYMWGNTRLGYWRVAGSPILSRAITNEKLVKAGYYVLAVNYEFKRLKHYGI